MSEEKHVCVLELLATSLHLTHCEHDRSMGPTFGTPDHQCIDIPPPFPRPLTYSSSKPSPFTSLFSFSLSPTRECVCVHFLVNTMMVLKKKSFALMT